ncbi:MAG TPA: cobalamin-binding protein [Gammaproteobacteria bacterium]|nr:cobalamin-binding protein [Gammaproteobacteria bacterium]
MQLNGADGITVTLKAPAQRVVSLAPDLSELLFDVGAGDTLLGTVEYSDYPAAAKAIPRVGDGFHVDVEKVLALKPDLVLAWAGGTPQALMDKLRALKLPVLAIATHELPDVAANLETLGSATGHEAAAAKAAGDFRERLAALQDSYAQAAPIRVFYEISAEPLFTVGGPQSISRLMRLCGGHNVFADLSELGPAVSLEAVLARDPQAIVTGDGEGDVAERFKRWQQWPQLSAVRYKNLYAVNDDWISRATPRLLDAGKQLCEDLDQARAHLDQKQ